MKRGRGRPKITLVELIKKEMLIKELKRSMIMDMLEWWRRKHVANPN